MSWWNQVELDDLLTNFPAKIPQVSMLLLVLVLANSKKVSKILEGTMIGLSFVLLYELYWAGLVLLSIPGLVVGALKSRLYSL